jgi:hypothetical protein
MHKFRNRINQLLNQSLINQFQQRRLIKLTSLKCYKQMLKSIIEPLYSQINLFAAVGLITQQACQWQVKKLTAISQFVFRTTDQFPSACRSDSRSCNRFGFFQNYITRLHTMYLIHCA